MKVRKVLGVGSGVLVLLLLYVWYHVTVIELGYQIQNLQDGAKKERKVHQELLIEVASLSSLDRIEQLATSRLGMVHASERDIVLVKRMPRPDPDGLKRYDHEQGIRVAESKGKAR
jgi:cell division protein FtsL